ncbi:MAG TPA: sulfite reductase subunit alpha [Steroidobacteraceae bacterium]|nr:sulfite reductase subunit alpha [Steroidobacteraceae bacterium]
MNTDPAHLLLAATATFAYILLCIGVWRRVRARRLVAASMAAPGGDPQHPALLVAWASQTGTAEGLAMQTTSALQAAGVAVQLRSFAALDAAALRSTAQALLVVSTYGEGDPPDNAAHFVAEVMRDSAVDLSGLRYGLLVLGDSSYRHFCGFGRQLDEWLQQRGARPLFQRIDVDNGDAQALQAWRESLGVIATLPDLPDWQGPPFEPWILRAREHLNPGSLGGPLFHIELVRKEGTTSGWQSGDLLQVQVPADPDHPRSYSIASIPADGALHLMVRLERREDGSAGLASGWLTHDAAIGTLVQARLRSHSQFRLGDNSGRDLILIGNGTGLAGLRAHLKQRALERHAGGPALRQWLLFGERQAAHDAPYAAEIAAWQATGVLTRLDLVYSRDGHAERYVQDRLRAQGERLREWVDAGAAIYVCGSLKGMAEGVAEVLREHLGEPLLAQLQQQGRYRRDVY